MAFERGGELIIENQLEDGAMAKVATAATGKRDEVICR
jgi:hypothetical protein